MVVPEGEVLTISGTLAQVNSDLTTLIEEVDASTTVAVAHSNGGTAETIPQKVASPLTGISVSDTGNTTTSGETFMATLADSNGILSATSNLAAGGDGTITRSSSGTTLTSSGTLQDTVSASDGNDTDHPVRRHGQ